MMWQMEWASTMFCTWPYAGATTCHESTKEYGYSV